MNTEIMNFANQTNDNIQKAALRLFAAHMPENFLDMAPLPADRFSQDGLFYEIKQHNENSPYAQTQKYTMVTIYKIENNSSVCPVRLSLEMPGKDQDDYSIVLHNQVEGQKHVIIENRDNDLYQTGNQLAGKTLSELVQFVLN